MVEATHTALTQERLPQPATRITQVRSAWLYQGDMRLDVGYYSDDAVQANRLLEECGATIRPLGRLASSVTYPTRFKRVYSSSSKYGAPFLTASMMMHFRPGSETYLVNQPEQAGKCMIGKDWILITRSGSVGRCVFTGERLARFAVSDDAIRVQTDIVPPGYLYAFLTSWPGRALLVKDQYGSAIKHLEPHHIAGIPVPILPDSEMQDIAGGIGQAYALREKANQLLDEATDALYRELGLPEFKENLINYLPSSTSDFSTAQMGVETLRSFAVSVTAMNTRLDASHYVPIGVAMQSGRYPLVDLDRTCQRIFYPGRFKRTYVSKEHGVPFLQGSHISLMKPYDLKYLAHIDQRNVQRCQIDRRWVLMTCSGTVGRVSVVSSIADKWAASQHIVRLVAKEPDYNPGYIALFLMTPYGQYQVRSKIYGAVIDELMSEDLAQVLIPDAPKAVQDAIGNKVLEAFENKDRANVIEDSTVQALESRLGATL